MTSDNFFFYKRNLELFSLLDSTDIFKGRASRNENMAHQNGGFTEQPFLCNDSLRICADSYAFSCQYDDKLCG
jgi:hypothetical protein